MLPSFSVGRLPRIDIGSGSHRLLPDIAPRYGRLLLLVTGARSLDGSEAGAWLLEGLWAASFSWDVLRVPGEPSPHLVDDAVADLRGSGIECVLGIGGGSVLDAAKAVAGLLKPGNSVMDHLWKGLARRSVIRARNAPYRRSRHRRHGLGAHPERRALDPRSLGIQEIVPGRTTRPPTRGGGPGSPGLLPSAADRGQRHGQLLESYLSTRASPFTDALALSGMEAVRDGLLAWYEGSSGAARGREKMAYAALASGIALAQTGLGSVHGLAAPLGAFFAIPHGVVCGTLVGAATRVNIEVLEAREPENSALAKSARVGRLLRSKSHLDDVGARVFLLHTLETWTRRLDLPALSSIGVSPGDIPRVVANCRGSSMTTNPVVLTDEEVSRILSRRL